MCEVSANDASIDEFPTAEYHSEVVANADARTLIAQAITVNGKLADYAMHRRAKSVLEPAKLDS